VSKERLDVVLTEKGLCETREKAKKTIMAGIVFVNGQREDKPGTKIDSELPIEIRGSVLKYVSRGGLKLEKAMKLYEINLNQKTCMDIGASTGGFTDCMLQNGANHVYAIDVGYGQLDWKLRNDSRVTNMERTNIRYVTLDSIGEPVDFISIDVAFISLKLVLPVAMNLLNDGGTLVFLIKPQFEAGRDQVKKRGVISDPKVHKEVVEKIITFCKENKIYIEKITFSPIKGPKGNIEFLAYGRKYLENESDFTIDVEMLINSAHEQLII